MHASKNAVLISLRDGCRVSDWVAGLVLDFPATATYQPKFVSVMDRDLNYTRKVNLGTRLPCGWVDLVDHPVRGRGSLCKGTPGNKGLVDNKWRRKRPSWGVARGIQNGMVLLARRLDAPCRGHANGLDGSRSESESIVGGGG